MAGGGYLDDTIDITDDIADIIKVGGTISGSTYGGRSVDEINQLFSKIPDEGPRGSLVPNMFGKTPKQVLSAKPKNWRKVAADGNGWKLVDENGIERVRFMRPDKNGKFHHNKTGYWRIQDEAGNFLDEFGNVVLRSDPDFHTKTHIPYSGT